MVQLFNWAGNYRFSASELLVPESMEQVQDIVARSRQIKVLGTRHSFNGLADTTGSLLSLQKLNRVVSLNHKKRQVTVEAGIRYGELCQFLHSQGFAVHNLASLPHITVAGACATASHGSGDSNGSLSSVVQAMEIVKADGSVVELSREQHADVFEGAVVGLGALGVVTKLTLDVIPQFQMSQYVYEHLPMAQLEDHLEAIFSSAYSVSLFTDWRDWNVNQIWRKHKVTDADHAPDALELYGAKRAARHMHPVSSLSAKHCSEQLGIAGPSHERLPHFRMDFTPSAGEELQSEYFVSREHAYPALCAIAGLSEHISPLLHVSEIRSIAADNLWMSPCYKQASIAVHFTWKSDWASVQKVLPLIEMQLEPFHARPHWSKLFTMPSAQVQLLYDKLPDFQRLLEQFDPAGKFHNTFLKEYILR